MSIRERAEAEFPMRTVTGVDNLAWAKRILFREQHGDKDLMPIQVQFAKQALGKSTCAGSTDTIYWEPE
jgi:hypothetical protein